MNKILNYISDQFVYWNLKKISHGYLILIDPREKEHFFGDKKSFLKAKIKINNPSFCFNILRKGSTGLGESYINGEFETDDLTSLIELSAKNINFTYKFSGFFQFSLIQSFLKRNIFTNTKERSKKNISLHYDLGNEFFSKWLDKTLTYSCGIFNSSSETLEKAQINKYNKLINMVKPRNGDRILEIGCGWGGFAEYIAKNYNIKLDCITISKKQFLYTKERIRRARLNHKVNVQMMDYRDVRNKYDIIILKHVFEHLYDPLKDLEKIRSHTNKYLFIEVPGNFRRMASIQNAHNFYFTENTLHKIVTKAGFNIISTEHCKETEFIFALYEKSKERNINFEYSYLKFPAR